MADLYNLADLPNASRVPEDIMERLTDAEARHRCEHAWDLENSPVHGDARTAVMQHAKKVLNALPVREAIERHRELHELAGQMPGSGVDSPAADIRANAAKVKEDNHYPPDLWQAAERRLNGGQDTYEPPGLLDQILGIGGQDEDGWQEPSAKAAIVKAAVAELDRQMGEVRKGADTLSARITRLQLAINERYVQERMPVPFTFAKGELSEAGVPDEIAELKQEAQRYSRLAKSVEDGELSREYAKRAGEAERGYQAALKRVGISEGVI